MPDISTVHPHSFSRRQFLASSTVAIAAGHCPHALQAKEQAEKQFGRLRVTDIEVHEISVPYEDSVSYELSHHFGPSRRVIYIVKTNSELVGLGESGSREPDATLQKYIGTNPFDWIGDETSLGLGTAMYDLMGQSAGVPVYKLFGQKYRSWVPVASWTVSSAPKRMANAVKSFASRGLHLDEISPLPI